MMELKQQVLMMQQGMAKHQSGMFSCTVDALPFPVLSSVSADAAAAAPS